MTGDLISAALREIREAVKLDQQGPAEESAATDYWKRAEEMLLDAIYPPEEE